MRGDSDYVIKQVNSGNLFRYKHRDGLPNSAAWVRLSHSLTQLDSLAGAANVNIVWEWVPRHLNVEADQLANLAMDNKSKEEADPSIRSTASVVDLDKALDCALDVLLRRRRRSLFMLPRVLTEEFVSLILCWHGKFNDAIFLRLFSIAPLIVSSCVSSIRSRSDFKAVQTHLQLLRQNIYLQDALYRMTFPTESPKSAVDLQKRLQTMCMRGLHSKVLKNVMPSEAFVIDDVRSVSDKIHAMFPVAPPVVGPAHVEQLPVTLCFNDVQLAVKKGKRGAASGLTGWTREWMLPFILSPIVPAHEVLVQVFTAIVNNKVEDHKLNEVLRTSRLVVLGYNSKPDKIRPVQIGDYLVRVASKVVLNPLLLKLKCSSFFATSCQRTLKKLQRALDDDLEVLSVDLTNAFNTVDRNLIRQVVKQQGNEELRPLFNLLYATPSAAISFDSSGELNLRLSVSNGVRQGCVLAPYLFARAMEMLRQNLPQLGSHRVEVIADDVSIYGEHPLQFWDAVVNTFQSGGLVLNMTKSLLILSSRRAALRQSHITTCSTPIKILGGVLFPIGSTTISIANALVFLRTKVLNRCEAVRTLPLTLQNKLIVATHLPRFLRYYIASIQITAESRDAVMQFWEWVDAQHSRLIQLSIGADSHHVLINSHIKDGGLGIQPICALFPKLSQFDDSNATRVWRELARSIPSSIGSQFPWQSVWPSNKLTTIADDETLQLFWKMRMEQKTIVKGCKEADSFSHILACRNCCPKQFWLRHQAVQHTLERTLRYYGLAVSRGGPPLPGNDVGGADLTLSYDGIFDFIDVTITQDKFATQAYSQKMLKYSALHRITQATISPFVMTVSAQIAPKTLRCIARWAIESFSPHEAAYAIIMNTQVATVKAVGSILKMVTKFGAGKFGLEGLSIIDSVNVHME